MKLGPAIPTICGGERDTFSRRYRRMRAKFVKAGDNTYYKRKYQRRVRATGKRQVAAESRLPWAHHLHPAESE
jgi:hypothetical protein